MTSLKPDWGRLEKAHPKALVVALRSAFERGSVSFTPRELSNAAHVAGHAAPTDGESLNLLESLSGSWLVRHDTWACPNCGEESVIDGPESEECSRCGSAFTHSGAWDPSTPPTPRFVFKGEPKRDVHWILVLHGMNTRGAWQERFNWLVARTYGRSVPVAIYKYGRVLSGAVLRPLQKARRNQLAERIRRFSYEVTNVGLRPEPDVIAHSFGTWLLGQALHEFPDLKVGRVILTGSILKRDFDWGRLHDRDQVEAVLNHFGSRDCWARISRYAIPDSGPSGYLGMQFDPDQWSPQFRAPDHRVAFNIRADGFGHSDFFNVDDRPVEQRIGCPIPKLDVLGQVFQSVWQPFLTDPVAIIRKREDLFET